MEWRKINGFERYSVSSDGQIRPVICLDTGVVYRSCTEASKETGANRSYIGQCALGKRKTAGGLRWQWRGQKED